MESDFDWLTKNWRRIHFKEGISANSNLNVLIEVFFQSQLLSRFQLTDFLLVNPWHRGKLPR